MSISEIQNRIASQLDRSNRSNGATRLIAVSKVQPIERVRAVVEGGHRLFGENKVQEAAGKWPALREEFGEINVHLLGPLQTNKARQAMELFQAIHSVDRPKLATTLARLRDELGHCPDLFIQINTGREEQKAGIAIEDADAFIAEVRALGLPLVGLMCIPPADEEPSLHFALLRKIAERNDLSELSMGMSGDFESAVAQGATYVRVGSAVFGDRDYG